AMDKAGKGLEAYVKAEHSHDVFIQLANNMVMDGKAAELERLLEAHRAHATDNADLLFYGALAMAILDRPAEAIPAFQKACLDQKADNLRHSYIDQFILTMFDKGHGLEAYR